MWVLMMVITYGANIVDADKSAPMTLADCQKAVNSARFATVAPAKADDAVAITFYCKKVN